MAKLSAPKKPTAKAAPKKPTSRSKTGNAACSEAASNWQLSLRGKAALSPDTYKTLAKCRSLNRAGKLAEAQGRTGKLSEMGEAAVKGRLQARFDSGLITQKARTEKLNLLLKQRSERGNAVVAKSATTEAKQPWEMTESEYVQSKKAYAKEKYGKDASESQIAMYRSNYGDRVMSAPRDAAIPMRVLESLQHPQRNALLKVSEQRQKSWNEDGPHAIWRMTYRDLLKDDPTRGKRSDFKGMHRKALQDAIAAGKSVPANVLAEYPDLKPAPPKAVEAKLGYSLGGKLAPGRGKDAPEYRDRLGKLTDKVRERAIRYELGRVDNARVPLRDFKERGKELRTGTFVRLREAYREESSKYVDSLHAMGKSSGTPSPATTNDKWLKKQISSVERAAKKKQDTEKAALKAGAVPLSMKPANLPKGFAATIAPTPKGNTVVVTKPVPGADYAAIQLSADPKKGKYTIMDPGSGLLLGGSYGSTKEAEAVAKKVDRLAKRASRGLSGKSTLQEIVYAPGREGYKKLIGKTLFGRQFGTFR